MLNVLSQTKVPKLFLFGKCQRFENQYGEYFTLFYLETQTDSLKCFWVSFQKHIRTICWNFWPIHSWLRSAGHLAHKYLFSSVHKCSIGQRLTLLSWIHAIRKTKLKLVAKCNFLDVVLRFCFSSSAQCYFLQIPSFMKCTSLPDYLIPPQHDTDTAVHQSCDVVINLVGFLQCRLASLNTDIL